MSAVDYRQPVDPAAEQRTHHEVVQLSDAELAARVRVDLGAKLAAYLGDVKETRAVRQWATGERSIRDRAVVQRYRLALEVLGIIRSRVSPEVAQAWFQGLNPVLDDQAPLAVLRSSSGDDDAARGVLGAARAFVAR